MRGGSVANSVWGELWVPLCICALRTLTTLAEHKVMMTNPNPSRAGLGRWGACHFLRDLPFLLLFLGPIALCTAAVLRRAVAMDLAGFGSSTEGAFPPSDMTSSRRC